MMLGLENFRKKLINFHVAQRYKKPLVSNHKH